MDDAGKEATAPKEAVSGHHPPPRAGASVTTRSAQLLHDHSLLTTSIWCGLVFGLALVLTAINLLPPTPVGYRVSTKVFASPQRLEVLKRHLLNDAVAGASGAVSEPRLVGLRVLDGHPKTASMPAAGSEALTLVEVGSLWPARTSSDQVHAWLNKLSEPDQRTLHKVDSASAERFARWEAQVAEHYLKHFRYTRHKGGDAEARGEGTLVTSADGPPARFASLTTAPAGANMPPATATTDDVETRLIQDFQRAAAREQSAATLVQEQALKLSGILTLAGSPHVRAQPGRVPSALILSVLIVAVAGGAVGGWVHYRAQSGGIFHAVEVAQNMDKLGLPALGIVHIAGAVQVPSGKVQRRVTGFRRWATKQLLALTELVVLFWCMAIAIRLVLDPLWRAMLWDNPLAALGRLFTGLP